MTEWSPMLESVVFDESTRESEWQLRVPRPLAWLARAAGYGDLTVRWRAKNVQELPPRLLSWRSLDGIENAGFVTFEELERYACHTLVLPYVTFHFLIYHRRLSFAGRRGRSRRLR